MDFTVVEHSIVVCIAVQYGEPYNVEQYNEEQYNVEQYNLVQHIEAYCIAEFCNSTEQSYLL